MDELLGVAVRPAVMYVYALALVRLSGKRSLGSLTPLDFVVTLIVGDMFDDVIWAEVPLANGIAGLGTVILVHGVLAYIGYAVPAFDRLVLGNYKVTVVKAGRWERDGMQRERLSEDEGRSHLRLLGEDKLSEIQEVNIEPSGSFGLLKRSFAKTAQKQDKAALKERLR